MARIQKQPAAVIISDLVDKLARVVSVGTRKVEQITGNEYELIDTGIRAVSVKAPFVLMSLDWHKNLEKSTVAFVITEIMPQLRMYNMLWYRPRSENSSQERQIMADLKKVKIIIPTETTDIYLVNPFILWRGTIPGVILATKHVINGHAPDLSMVIDLKAPKRSELKTITEAARQAMYLSNNSEITDI